MNIFETSTIARSRWGPMSSLSSVSCNISSASEPFDNVENPTGISAARSSSTKVSWKRRTCSILRVTSSTSTSENIYRVAFLSLDGVDTAWPSGNEICEARGRGECEGVREFEDDADIMKVADVGERVNVDIDIFEDELVTDRQLKIGS